MKFIISIKSREGVLTYNSTLILPISIQNPREKLINHLSSRIFFTVNLCVVTQTSFSYESALLQLTEFPRQFSIPRHLIR